ncbi:MAG TPA: methylmalonyl Co-A mutase-associated GTPase MeaB [Nitrososphaerales archaeon]|nr:methylmalonyl Co-A mutase-associated GTPase MeaB [Nitrososphaerales archaeon]
MKTNRLGARVKAGDRNALSQAITFVEDDQEKAGRLLGSLRCEGNAFVIGVTGAPGTGKSTLIARLIQAYRKKGAKVGVVAVDPTSPLTGGALLGDRVRMSDFSNDPGVYIRSMASRGWTGGLSRAVADVVRLYDAAGMDVAIVETVGTGQSETEVVGISHVVLVVLIPGMGDEVQASKAGLMEVGDIFVVNKSDLPGADREVVSILSMTRGRAESKAVVKVSAAKGEGIEKLFTMLETKRRAFLEGNVEARAKSVRGMIIELAKADLLERVSKYPPKEIDALANGVLQKKVSVEDAAEDLVKRISGARPGRTSAR